MRISDCSSDVCSSDLRAKDEQSVAFLDVAAIDERVDAGAIGHQERGTFREIMALGQMIDIVDADRDGFGHSAIAAARNHAVADLEFGHAFADYGDQSRDLAARRDRAFGAELI